MLRLNRFLVAGSIIAAGSLSLTSVSAQQTTISPTGKANQPLPAKGKAQFIASKWGVNCPPQPGSKKLTCILSQSIVVAKTRKVFIMVSVRPTPAKTLKEPYVAVVRLPHGLALAKGVTYQIDDQPPANVPLYTTSPQGVFARLGLTGKLMSSLKKGKKLNVSFSARGGRKFIVPMSLQGFAAGFEKVK